MEAFIHIPATVLQTVRCVYPVCSDNTFTLQFITYRNARLFPIIHRHSFKRQPLEVTTNVISAKIGASPFGSFLFVDVKRDEPK